MLHVLTPKGVLREVVKSEPVCEARVKFNGGVKRVVEVAEGMDSKPTALNILFRHTEGQFLGMCCGNELFIGNLKPEKVSEIQGKLLSEGFYDFSRLHYQKAFIVDKTVFDEGVSDPYTSSYTAGAQMLVPCAHCFEQDKLFTEAEDSVEEEWKEEGGADEQE